MLPEKAIPWLKAGLNTAKAPFWKVSLAKIFGKKVTGHDGVHICTGYLWGGVLYMTDFEGPD